MADEIKKEEAAVENKAAEAVAEASEQAKKDAEAAEKEAQRIAKKSGEEEAQKWLEGKLAGIETNLSTKIAAIQTWFQEEMGKFQQKIFDQTKEQLSKKESSTPENSTPAQTPEKVAEKSGSQSETSAGGNRERQAKKRRRI